MIPVIRADIQFERLKFLVGEPTVGPIPPPQIRGVKSIK